MPSRENQRAPRANRKWEACVEGRGQVSDARQIELLRKIRFCFRWPLA
jgi:hypothetical protein